MLLAIALVLSASMVVLGQGRVRQGGAHGPQGGRNYNPATETTFAGTVDEVKNIPGPAGGLGGLHLMVRTDTGVQDVHLGPATYVTSKQFAFTKGDAITVTGSKTTVEGEDVVIAREVKKGDRVLTLRNPQGIPRWSGRARRSS
jgi:hypothetical protein